MDLYWSILIKWFMSFVKQLFIIRPTSKIAVGRKSPRDVPMEHKIAWILFYVP